MKAAQPLAGHCVVACRLTPTDSGSAPTLNDNPSRHSGEIQSGLIERLTTILERLPMRSQLELISQEASFRNAFPGGGNWIESWQKDNFTHKPGHDRAAWRKLLEVMIARQISITARALLTDDDGILLEELRIAARQAANPDYDPSEARSYSSFDEEGFKRAMEKDK